MYTESESCCLCCEPYEIYHEIFDDTDEVNDVFETAKTYFPEEMLKTKKPLESNVLCSKCWDIITDFDFFRKNIYELHEILNITCNTVTNVTKDCTAEELIVTKRETEDNMLNKDAAMYLETSTIQGENNENSKSKTSVHDIIDIIQNIEDGDITIKQEEMEELDKNDITDAIIEIGDEIIYCEDNAKTEILLKDSSVEQKSNEQMEFVVKNEIIESSDDFIDDINDNSNNEESMERLENVDDQIEIIEMKLENDVDNSINLESMDNAEYIADDISNNEKRIEHLRKLKASENDIIFANGMPFFKCYKCKEFFNELTQLRVHFKDKHPRLQFYINCCDRKYRVRYHILEHLRLHYKPELFKCKYCGDCFSKEHYLLNHIRNLHTNLASAEDIKIMKEYEKFIKEKMPFLKCYICQGSFKTFTLLCSHFKEQHPMKQFYVQCCNSKLSKRSLLVYHLREHDHHIQNNSHNITDHEGENNTFVVGENNDEILDTNDHHIQNNSHNITDHEGEINTFVVGENNDEILDTNEEDEIIYCEDDDNSNIDYQVINISVEQQNDKLLDKTAKSKHLKALEEAKIFAKCMPNFKCYKCKQIFNEYSEYRLHFKDFHSKLQFYVICCEKKFLVRNQLLDHLRLHYNPEMFKCEFCGICYKNRYYLLDHIRKMHKDVAALETLKKLDIAKERRGIKSLEYEVFIKEKMPILKCYICQQSFVSYTSLNNHFKLEHPKETFYIKCCNSKLSKRALLVYHLREHDNVNKKIKTSEETINQLSSKVNKEIFKDNTSQTSNIINDFGNEYEVNIEEMNMNKTTNNSDNEVVKDKIMIDGNSLNNDDNNTSNADYNKNLTANEDENIIRKYLPKMKCYKCQKTFNNFSLIRNHFRYKHSRLQFYITCCGKKFLTRFRLLKHLRLHENPELYKCDICGECRTTQANLNQHKLIIHKIELNINRKTIMKRKEQISLTRLKTAKEFDDIIAKVIPKIECYICNKGFRKFVLLKEHFKKRHPMLKFYVRCCKRKIHCRYNLVQHIRLQHLNEETKNSNNSIANNSNLNENEIALKSPSLENHRDDNNQEIKTISAKKHTNLITEYECTICQKKFLYESSLKSHVLQHKNATKNDDDDQLSCPHCKRKYYSKRQLQAHIRVTHRYLISTPENQIKCKHCDEILINKYYERKHLIMHGLKKPTPRKTYYCNICNKTLQGMDNLKRHNIVKHTESTTEYICNVCGKTTYNIVALYHHKRRAHTEQTFNCNDCTKIFRSKTALKEHISVVHLKKNSYKCPNCNMEFKRLSDVRYHRQKLHPAEYEKSRRPRTQMVDRSKIKNKLVL